MFDLKKKVDWQLSIYLCFQITFSITQRGIQIQREWESYRPHPLNKSTKSLFSSPPTPNQNPGYQIGIKLYEKRSMNNKNFT